MDKRWTPTPLRGFRKLAQHMKTMGKHPQILKLAIVTTLSSPGLDTLRKQTWKNKSYSFKSFLFQSFPSTGCRVLALTSGHFNSILSSTLIRPIHFLSFVIG